MGVVVVTVIMGVDMFMLQGCMEVLMVMGLHQVEKHYQQH